MKKLILSVATLCSAVALCACSPISDAPVVRTGTESGYSYAEAQTEVLPDELACDLKTAYDEYCPFESEEQYSPDKIIYFGEFNGVHVVYPWGLYPVLHLSFYERIDGVTFVYCDSAPLNVYNDGKIYRLSAAFDNGLLSHDDLVAIREKFRPNFDESAEIAALPLR